MHHVALNGARPDNCHFDHDAVKTFWLQTRQRRHLPPTFDLENANGVGRLHHLKSFRVVFWDVREIERPAAFATKLKPVLHHRHHPQPEQIDFHDPEIFAIIFVPLRYHPARHGCVFQGHERAQFVLANNHPARVLAEMPRQSVDGVIQTDEGRHPRMRFRQTGLLDLCFELESVWEIAVREQMRKAIERTR